MPPAPRELPIDELEARLIAAVRGQDRLIVQARAGSGKSTEVPQMLPNHGLLGSGELVMLHRDDYFLLSLARFSDGGVR